MSNQLEGWHIHNGKERHYFVNKDGFYRSLCARVLLFAPIRSPLFDQKDEDPYNCIECKALLKERDNIDDVS